MTPFKRRIVSALVLFGAGFVSACGSDSTGPGSVDSNAALQSLGLGLQTAIGDGSPTTPDASAALSAFAPLLDQVTVTIDGTSRRMFALGIRQTFPDGTCEETLFVDPQFPPPPGVCTPPSLGVTFILWQSHAATQLPDRMIFIEADAGTSNFDFTTSPTAVFPALALYIEGTTHFWSSLSGSLTTQVTGTNQSCTFPLPPYAKSGTCRIAGFDEQGSIVFEEFLADGSTGRQATLVIPRQTVDGLWIAISEVQSVPFSASRSVRGMMGMRRLDRIAPQLIRAR